MFSLWPFQPPPLPHPLPPVCHLPDFVHPVSQGSCCWPGWAPSPPLPTPTSTITFGSLNIFSSSPCHIMELVQWDTPFSQMSFPMSRLLLICDWVPVCLWGVKGNYIGRKSARVVQLERTQWPITRLSLRCQGWNVCVFKWNTYNLFMQMITTLGSRWLWLFPLYFFEAHRPHPCRKT